MPRGNIRAASSHCDAVVDAVIGQRLSKKTQKNYGNNQRSFGTWLTANGLSRYVGPDGMPTAHLLVQDLENTFYRYCMVKFGVNVEEGSTGVLEAGQLVAEGVRFTTVSDYRAALNDLLKKQKQKLTEEQEEKMSAFFSALKKIDARRRKAQGGEMGKSLMPYALYQHLAGVFMHGARDDTAWAHCFLVMTWNLMCRASSTNGIAIKDMSWDQDALLVRFAERRTDQSSEGAKVPRHVFANPYRPELCPIVALACYLLTISGREALLFPAKDQEGRFSKLLSDYLNSSEGELYMAELAGGLQPTDITTHSLPRGSASYAASGSTATPNALSMLRRGGWPASSSREIDVDVLPAGDCYIGRLACGLDVNSEHFAVLPPHFPARCELARQAVHDVYGTLLRSHGDHILDVALMCLASLVHHSTWLREHLPDNLNTHDVFRNDERLAALRVLLVTGNASEHMTATGIPPHVQQLVKMAQVEKLMWVRHAEMLEREAALVNNFEAILDRRVEERGGMTRQTMTEIVQEAMQAANVRPGGPQVDVEDLPEGSAGGGEEEEEDGSGRVDVDVYSWGGTFHLVPSGWKLPRANLKRGWELWWLGEGGRRPAYRNLPTKDRAHCSATYCYWSTVYRKMEAFLKARNALVERPSPQQLGLMYERALPLVRFTLDKYLTERSRPRLDEIRLSYAYKAFSQLTEDDMSSLE